MRSAVITLLGSVFATGANAHCTSGISPCIQVAVTYKRLDLFGRLILDGQWTDTWEYVRYVFEHGALLRDALNLSC